MNSVHISEPTWPVYDAKVRDGKTPVLTWSARRRHGSYMSMNPDVLLRLPFPSGSLRASMPWSRRPSPTATNRSKRAAAETICRARPAWMGRP